AVGGRAETSGSEAFVRAAGEEAIARGEAQAVRLDPEARRVAITAGASDAVRSMRSFTCLLSIEPDPPEAITLTFEPLGFSNGATYRILAPGNRHYVILVDPFTGRVITRLANS